MTFLVPLLFAVLDGDDSRELAGRLKRRDPDALEELYNRYGRIIFSLIARIVQDAAVAEDLTQETFLRAWNRVQGFDQERGRLGPWLLTIARNRAIDYIRSVEGKVATNTLELTASENPSHFVHMEDDILNQDRARRLRAAFERLTTNQRTVIELAYFEGLSQLEMAAKLNQPLGTVKTWTRSALRALRDSLTMETK